MAFRLRAVVALSLSSAVAAMGGKSAVATFDGTQNGVRGTVKFCQTAPHHDVRISVDIHGLTQGPNPWHVHKLPADLGLATLPAILASTAGHFDPLNTGPANYLRVPFPYPPGTCPSNGNICEIGDLSARLGLWSTADVKQVYRSDFLTLFGDLSIIGRSIVIHNATTARQATANIVQVDVPVTVAKADFSAVPGGPVGSVTFTQGGRKDDEPADTAIVVDLSFPDTRQIASAPWGVVNPHTNALFNTTGGPLCLPNPGLWKFCVDGDLSGKHGNILLNNTAALTPQARRYFFTDTVITLRGDRSIVGSNLFIKDPTGPVYAAPIVAVGTTYPKPSPDDSKDNDEDEDGRRKSSRVPAAGASGGYLEVSAAAFPPAPPRQPYLPPAPGLAPAGAADQAVPGIPAILVSHGLQQSELGPLSDVTARFTPSRSSPPALSRTEVSTGTLILGDDHRHTALSVALKRCQFRPGMEEPTIRILREYKALKRSRSPFIVRLIYDMLHITYAGDGFEVALVMHAAKGDLSSLITSSDWPTPAEVEQLVYSLVEALRYLHDELHLMHRDLRPQNVLYKPNTIGGPVIGRWAFQICDFDSSVGCDDDGRVTLGAETIRDGFVEPYAAIELKQAKVYKCDSYDVRGDIFGLGTVVTEFATKQPFSDHLYRDTLKPKALDKTLTNLLAPRIFPAGPFDRSFADLLRRFLSRCLTQPATRRPFARTLLATSALPRLAYERRALIVPEALLEQAEAVPAAMEVKRHMTLHYPGHHGYDHLFKAVTGEGFGFLPSDLATLTNHSVNKHLRGVVEKHQKKQAADDAASVATAASSSDASTTTTTSSSTSTTTGSMAPAVDRVTDAQPARLLWALSKVI